MLITLAKIAAALLLLVILCGPSPVSGAKEIGSLVSKRASEWRDFAKDTRESVDDARVKAGKKLAQR